MLVEQEQTKKIRTKGPASVNQVGTKKPPGVEPGDQSLRVLRLDLPRGKWPSRDNRRTQSAFR